MLNGDPSQLLTDMTGFPTITLCLRDEALYGLIKDSKAFQKTLNAYMDQGYLVLANRDAAYQVVECQERIHISSKMGEFPEGFHLLD